MYKIIVFALIVFSVGALGAPRENCQPTKTTFGGVAALKTQTDVCAGDLVFNEEFDYLNMNTWSWDTWSGDANGEFQTYVSDGSTAWTSDGKLIIKPRLLPTTAEEDKNITATPQKKLKHLESARLFSSGFHFKYGHVEVVAKACQGDWLWPAIWLMPYNSAYGDWPRSGEIDIMEVRGNVDMENERGENIGAFRDISTLHWGPDGAHNQYWRTRGTHNNLTYGYYNHFHTYYMDWNADGLVLGVDQHEVMRVNPPSGGFWEYGELSSSGQSNPWSGGSKMAPFDKNFYFIVNVAVGGTIGFFIDGYGNKPWSNSDGDAAAGKFWAAKSQWEPTWHLDSGDTAALQIKSIKVWAN